MRYVPEQPFHRLLHIRVEMHRVDNFHIPASSQGFQRGADIFERLPEILAAVGGDKNESTRFLASRLNAKLFKQFCYFARSRLH